MKIELQPDEVKMVLDGLSWLPVRFALPLMKKIETELTHDMQRDDPDEKNSDNSDPAG